jgi:hypothetical protein
MKTSEFMIGDYVINTEFGKNKIDKIETLEPRRVWLEHGKTYVPIEFIEPIPLTTEILEKNGFVKDEKNSNMYYWNWSVIDDCMSYDKETSKVRIFYVSGLTFVKILQYVHELQNALRICEIEKEIEL